jgi:Ca-activated chloride channel homolog
MKKCRLVSLINKSKQMGIRLILCAAIVFSGTTLAKGQGRLLGPNFNKNIRQGNNQYDRGKYEQAAQDYQKVLAENPNHPIANFNMGNLLFRQNMHDSAAAYFQNAIGNLKSDQHQARGYYNLGNSLLAKGDLQKSIEAYKQSLRLDPNSEDTRYNLSYALKMLKQQEQQKQQQQDEKDKGDQKDKQNDQNQQAEQNKDQKPKELQENKSDQMSKQEAEALLNALNNREKDLQKNIKKVEGRPATSPSGKDW